jgi:hypothetical protein
MVLDGDLPAEDFHLLVHAHAGRTQVNVAESQMLGQNPPKLRLLQIETLVFNQSWFSSKREE